jgi:hypothetical protein
MHEKPFLAIGSAQTAVVKFVAVKAFQLNKWAYSENHAHGFRFGLAMTLRRGFTVHLRHSDFQGPLLLL